MPDSEHRALIRNIAARFTGRWYRGYVHGKLRSDPVYAAVATLLANNDRAVLDIGCGLGLLGFYLRATGFRGPYLGIDFDAPKIAEARRVADAGANDLAFEIGVAGTLPEFSGNVVMLDVLHYLPAAGQQQLLREAALRTDAGGLLIMRNVLRAPSWRFHATRIEEYFLHAFRWMRSPPRHYPDRDEIAAPLAAAGLSVEVHPLWGKTPFNSYLIVARRDATGAQR